LNQRSYANRRKGKKKVQMQHYDGIRSLNGRRIPNIDVGNEPEHKNKDGVRHNNSLYCVGDLLFIIIGSNIFGYKIKGRNRHCNKDDDN
jgi:hypothetical protein